MTIALWTIQFLLAAMFFMAGSMKAFQYAKAREKLPWVKDVSKGLVIFIGYVELLGAIGLILPAATGIAPTLTAAAAGGLATVMFLAAGFHLKRGEKPVVGFNLILMALALFVAYARIAG